MKLREVPADMIAAADKVGHQTVWLKGNKEAFIFITWCPETMKKAQKALDDAGVLCDLTIGYVPPLRCTGCTDLRCTDCDACPATGFPCEREGCSTGHCELKQQERLD